VAAVLGLGLEARVPRLVRWSITAAPLALATRSDASVCFFVNDDYGHPATLPWAMKFSEGLPPTTVVS